MTVAGSALGDAVDYIQDWKNSDGLYVSQTGKAYILGMNYSTATVRATESITTDTSHTIDVSGAKNLGEIYITAGNGTNVITGSDIVNGSDDSNSGRDIIVSGNGNNLIDAKGGKNEVTTGTGNDTISSGAGSDIISSGAGDDVVNAGAGSDKVFTGGGYNKINVGNDNGSADSSADSIYIDNFQARYQITGFGTGDKIYLDSRILSSFSSALGITTPGSYNITATADKSGTLGAGQAYDNGWYIVSELLYDVTYDGILSAYNATPTDPDSASPMNGPLAFGWSSNGAWNNDVHIAAD